MSNILGIAVSGLNAAAARIANAANNIVNASSTNFQPQDIVSLSNGVGGVTTYQKPRASAPTPAAPVITASTPTITGPTATTQINLAANLPAQVPTGFTSTPVPAQIYDSLGNAQTLSLTFTKTGVDTWNANITAPNGASPSGNFSATVPLTFSNGSGGTPAGTLTPIASGANYTGSNGQVQFALSYPGAGTQNVTLSFGTPGSSVNGVTQFADANAAVSVTNLSQNGSAYNVQAAPTNVATAPVAVSNGVDIAAELVNTLAAKTEYGASAAVVKTAIQMDKALLDIKA